MSRVRVRALLEAALREFTGPRALAVAAENRHFLPYGPYVPYGPDRQPYVAAHLLVHAEGPAALGPEAPESMEGIFQITVVTLAGMSTAPAETLADDIKSHFARRIFGGPGVTLRVPRVRTRQGLPDAKTYTLPVDVYFQALFYL